MSEQEQERPLTRRELRLREQAAQESAAQAAEPTPELGTPDVQSSSINDGSDFEIEISPLNDDGSVRTRREIRALRDAAYAEWQAERGTAEDLDSDLQLESDAEVEEAPTGLYVADIARASTEADDSNGVDVSFGPPTEAFSIEDLLDAVQPVAPTGDADAVAALFADEETSFDDEEVDEIDDSVEAGPVEAGSVETDRFEADADESAEAAESAGFEEEVLDEVDQAEEDVAADDAIEHGAEDSEYLDNDNDDEDEAADGDDESDPPAAEAKPEGQATGYSFPDIQPPEEWRSVFDDPSRITSLKNQGGTGDFDDLISRAVAQEGSTGSTGVSALILPSRPGDTGGLAGPLGVTGELFVTGSIELPKSLGETGGHAALLDSVETNQFLTGEQTSAIETAPSDGPMPVSALSAVSARRRPEVPVVAEPTKDKSKMPIILALSGGGLLIVIAGAVILAATQGWFA